MGLCPTQEGASTLLVRLSFKKKLLPRERRALAMGLHPKENVLCVDLILKEETVIMRASRSACGPGPRKLR